MQEALTADEASKILGIGVHQLRNWMRKPYFPAVRVGKNDYVIFRTTLMNWISDPIPHHAFKLDSRPEEYA